MQDEKLFLQINSTIYVVILLKTTVRHYKKEERKIPVGQSILFTMFLLTIYMYVQERTLQFESKISVLVD